jgi:hypothetical protein
MNRRIDPFSLDSLNRIFKLDKSDPPRLKTRENSWLEFKESFNWGSRTKDVKTTVPHIIEKDNHYVVRQ